jgi:probable phosphoglycerate mutase
MFRTSSRFSATFFKALDRTTMIYLLRHGETVWNTLGRFQGQKDSPLTMQGIEQADFVAKVLHRELAEDLHSFEMQVSPLGRARETANRIQHLLPIVAVEDARLAEVTVGSWDGMTKFEIDAEYPGALDGSDIFDWYFRSPDGESFDEACERAKAWINNVQCPTVAISHGLFGRLVRGVYAGLSKREMLQLPVPQDGFYRLYEGEIIFIGGSSAETVAPM